MNARERNRLRDASLLSPAPEPMPNTKAAELAQMLSSHRGERHIVVIQSFPDPDAISSAFAHQMICQRYDIEADIAYDGIISHHENLALVELLDIPLVRIQDSDDLTRYKGSAFIDTQGTTTGLTGRLASAGVPVLMVVDHHEPQGVLDALFSDVRTDANATATIYTEYLEHGMLELERGDEEHTRLATALMHGLRSETGGLIRGERADFLAAGYLADFIDRVALETILSIQRSRNAMDIIRSALEARIVRDSYSIAGVGYLRYEDRDAIPQAADFLLTEENVHTAIVYGVVAKPNERELLIGSLRTKKPTLNPDSFLKEALGGEAGGRPYGGGRREAGGFEIPVGFLSGAHDDEFMRYKWQLFDQQIKRKIWTRLGVQEHD
jgi:nanoRNase/pAp phosphatase (c-di-AMP/oligoRNAs hydrolase)